MAGGGGGVTPATPFLKSTPEDLNNKENEE